MASNRRDPDRVRELRLEGIGLYLVGLVIVVVLGAAFYGGRLYERSTRPAGDAAYDVENPLENVVRGEEPADVDADANYFDRVDGGEKQAEPQREAAGPAAEPPPTAERPEQPPMAATGGSFYVQVFAGRDRSLAGTVLDKLQTAGYAARLDRVPEGQGALYKVRVGGYGERAEADAAAERLKNGGFPGAWVTVVE
jgi:cell division septation protein DedD